MSKTTHGGDAAAILQENKSSWKKWQMVQDLFHPIQEICTADGSALARSLEFVYIKSKLGK